LLSNGRLLLLLFWLLGIVYLAVEFKMIIIGHTASSLRLFVPSSLSVYHLSFFSEVSAGDIIFLWLGLSRGDHFPPALELY
jgi:hypothetical protein